MTTIIGLMILYSVGHFFFIQTKAWTVRTQYERVVSVIAMVGIGLIFIGMMG